MMRTKTNPIAQKGATILNTDFKFDFIVIMQFGSFSAQVKEHISESKSPLRSCLEREDSVCVTKGAETS